MKTIVSIFNKVHTFLRQIHTFFKKNKKIKYFIISAIIIAILIPLIDLIKPYIYYISRDKVTTATLDELNLENYDNLIILKTCSKALGSAALRLGFAVANKTLTNVIRAVKSPYNVNSVSQALGEVLFAHPDYIDECIKTVVNSRKELYKEILEIKSDKIEKVYETHTNFVFMKVKNAKEVFDKIELVVHVVIKRLDRRQTYIKNIYIILGNSIITLDKNYVLCLAHIYNRLVGKKYKS